MTLEKFHKTPQWSQKTEAVVFLQATLWMTFFGLGDELCFHWINFLDCLCKYEC